MILALVEHDRSSLNDNSLEMLTLARDLTHKLNTSLEAVLVGEDTSTAAEGLAAYGVSQVHLIQHDRLGDYAPEAWAQSIVYLIATNAPQVVMAAGTDRGNEVMAHVAVRTGLPMAANCTEIHPGDPYQILRVRWGGSLFEEALIKGEPKLLTVAPYMIPAEEAPLDGELSQNVVTPPLEDKDFRVRVNDRIEAREGVSLAGARVVVGGGRGVGSSEKFDILEELAGLLNGTVGGTRVVTSNGWRPHSDQIGQTGSRIAPDLYIACGISGAIQHWVGCMGAKKVLAINTDPEAAIIAKADYAIIGDLHEVIPALSAEISKIQNG
jgi:electron transfer flavoprotein alpha subunit